MCRKKNCNKAPFKDGLCPIHYDELIFQKTLHRYKPDEMMRAIKLYIPDEYLNEELPYTNMLVEGIKKMRIDYEVLKEVKEKLGIK